MKCQNCNRTVTRKSKFCPHCGNSISLKKIADNEPQKPKIAIGYAVVLVMAGVILGFVITQLGGNTEAPVQQSIMTAPTTIASTSSQVLEIAKEFMCPCGTCNDALDPCLCEHKNGALEVKTFIAQQLQSGHKKPHIVEMVQQKYLPKRNDPLALFEFEQLLN